MLSTMILSVMFVSFVFVTIAIKTAARDERLEMSDQVLIEQCRRLAIHRTYYLEKIKPLTAGKPCLRGPVSFAATPYLGMFTAT